MSTTFSLHQIRNEDSFPFDAEAYSRFKFGDVLSAEKFGTSLANAFIKEHLQNKTDIGQMVVISSPYSFIPTATYCMKDFFTFTLNHWLAEKNLPVLQETKVHRNVTYRADYGELDSNERMQLIGNDVFQIDTAFIEGKTLLFLDDIRITGSHEKMIQKMITNYQITNKYYLLYFCELCNLQIHPKIENKLNYYSVKGLDDILSLIISSNFQFNTRVIKFILNSNYNEFVHFIHKLSDSLIKQIYNLSIGNQYHTIPEYKGNLTYIKNNYILNKTQYGY